MYQFCRWGFLNPKVFNDDNPHAPHVLFVMVFKGRHDIYVRSRPHTSGSTPDPSPTVRECFSLWVFGEWGVFPGYQNQ